MLKHKTILLSARFLILLGSEVFDVVLLLMQVVVAVTVVTVVAIIVN